MYSRVILLFDLHSNQHHVNPNYITSLEQKGLNTIVHMLDYSFETRESLDMINQNIHHYDMMNRPSVFDKV